MPLRSPVVMLAPLLVAAACSPVRPVLPVVCGESASGGGDTVRVIVHVDSLRPGTSGEALVRVDPLGQGNVTFEAPPPPTAVAVSAAFTLAGVFQGCFAEDPAALVVRTPEAPRGKAWLAISSNRVVRVRVETGEPGPGATVASEWIVVEPGASARGSWSVEEGP